MTKSSDSRFNRCLYFSSNALARKMEKLALESWKTIDLSPSHAYLLMMVLEEAGSQPGEIAKQLLLTPSTVTRLIEKLEEKKLVSRIAEGKITRVNATAKAKALYPKMKHCMNDFTRQYSAILGPDESARMVQNINKLTDKLAG